jgi:hypothetical protein
MKEELQQEIFNAAPLFFRQKDLSMQETCLYWGLECGNGWKEILTDLAETVERHNIRLREKGLPVVEATQVKEKFGGLRVYTSHVDDFIDGAIEMAERACERTCEVCGSPGKIGGKNWLSCLCNECREESEKKLQRKINIVKDKLDKIDEKESQ